MVEACVRLPLYCLCLKNSAALYDRLELHCSCRLYTRPVLRACWLSFAVVPPDCSLYACNFTLRITRPDTLGAAELRADPGPTPLTCTMSKHVKVLQQLACTESNQIQLLIKRPNMCERCQLQPRHLLVSGQTYRERVVRAHPWVNSSQATVVVGVGSVWVMDLRVRVNKPTSRGCGLAPYDSSKILLYAKK